jgi:hypothetical protein
VYRCSIPLPLQPPASCLIIPHRRPSISSSSTHRFPSLARRAPGIIITLLLHRRRLRITTLTLILTLTTPLTLTLTIPLILPQRRRPSTTDGKMSPTGIFLQCKNTGNNLRTPRRTRRTRPILPESP